MEMSNTDKGRESEPRDADEEHYSPFESRKHDN